MSGTKRELISRLRSSLNEVNADTHFTNRYLWSELWSAAKTVIKQDADYSRRLYNQAGLWQSICVKMEPVSPILCTCLAIPLDCVLYRSTYKLPKILESSFGFVYRFIASPDLSVKFTLVTPYDYDRKSKIKYNKEKYAFIHDGYLWSPNAQFPLLNLSGIFEDATLNLPEFNCDTPVDTTSDCNCNSLLDTSSGIPDYLETNIMRIALDTLGRSKQTAGDHLINQNENQKEVSP